MLWPVKTRDAQLDRAKKRLLGHIEGCAWFCGLGVGQVADGVGLVMSVRRGSRRTALRRLAELSLAVEVDVREVGTVRARDPVTAAHAAVPAKRRGGTPSQR